MKNHDCIYPSVGKKECPICEDKPSKLVKEVMDKCKPGSFESRFTKVIEWKYFKNTLMEVEKRAREEAYEERIDFKDLIFATRLLLGRAEDKAKEEGRQETIKEIYKDLLTRDEHIRRVKQQAESKWQEEHKKCNKCKENVKAYLFGCNNCNKLKQAEAKGQEEHNKMVKQYNDLLSSTNKIANELLIAEAKGYENGLKHAKSFKRAKDVNQMLLDAEAKGWNDCIKYFKEFPRYKPTGAILIYPKDLKTIKEKKG